MSNAIGKVTAMVVADTKKLKTGLNSATDDIRKWGRQSQKVFDSTRTPAEQMSMEIAKLNAMHKKGYIDAVTHARGVRKLNDAYYSANFAAKKLATTTRAGGMMGGGMMLMGGQIGAAMGSIAMLKKMGSEAATFQQAMQSSLAIMGNVGSSQRGEMADIAHEVAATTKFSADEAAKAYYFLASAGMDAAQSLKALPTVAKFAQAGMFDLSTATDLLTDAQMALGMSSKDARANLKSLTHVGDVLVKANTVANASVQQFSEALTNKAAAAARYFKKDIEEVTATLAVFASRGIKGADAGTQYDIVMRHLSIRAEENAEAFKAAGIAVYDQAGAMRNLADIIGDMERTMKGMSAEQKVATLMSLGFTAQTISTTNSLVGASQQMRAYEAELRRAGGTMAAVADNQLTPLTKGWNELTASMERWSSDTLSGHVSLLGDAFAYVAKNIQSVLDGVKYGSERITKFTADSLETLGRLPGGGQFAETAKMMKEDAQRQKQLQVMASIRARESQMSEVADLGADAKQMSHLKKLAMDARRAEAAARRSRESMPDSNWTRILGEREEEAADKFSAAIAKVRDTFEEAAKASREMVDNIARSKEEAASVAKAAQDATMRRGESLTKSLLTPSEQLNRAQMDALALHAAGAIDATTLSRAMDKAMADFAKGAGIPDPFDMPGLSSKGKSAEEYGGVTASLRNSSAARQSFVDANAGVRRDEERNRLLKDSRRLLESIEAGLVDLEVAEAP